MTRIWLVPVAIIGGFLLGVAVANRVPLGADASVKWHWKRVNDYRAFMNDPSHLSEVLGTGLIAVTTPYEIEPSLNALASEGEIYCADILLPTVPANSRINHRWIKYLGEHPDVLYAHGLPQSSALRVTGSQPLYLKIWFRKSALPDIQKLIDELEALALDGGEVPP